MSIAPDFSPLVSGINIMSIVNPILGTGCFVLALILTVWTVKEILKLLGYDIDAERQKSERNKRYHKRYERESDASNYAKWKEDRGF